MDPDPSFDPSAVEESLRRLPIVELKGLFRRSSNYTFLVELRGGCGPPKSVLAVYKPARGEAPLWDFPAGTLYRREVAAYLLARHLGWPRVPPTVVREQAPHGVGALQLFVDARPELHHRASGGRRDPAWMDIAVFDVLTNNADRKAGHCLTDAQGRVWIIDHGLTFHVEPKLRTVIWDFAGRPLPPRLRPALERVANSLQGGELAHALAELIDRGELDMLRQRVDTILKPTWRMPHPTSAWSVPWPPV
jgi:hypothetical protein